MKVTQINAVLEKGSTGKICASISGKLSSKGIENYILYSSGKSTLQNSFLCASRMELKIQALKSRVLGNYGFNSVSQTKRMIKRLQQINPDIVHLHNIHGHDCHVEMLFDYLRDNNIKVFWTFHDCWAFTAYCPHYSMLKCDQWMDKCEKCPQRKRYSFFWDRSAYLFEKKQKSLSNIDLTIVTPSQWLANQVEQSFLRDYPIKVINNGINLNVFKPTESDFRAQHKISQNKKIVLGVAFDWGVRKGLDVFIELSKRLPNNEYKIVLVGTNEEIDTQLPSNIISIHKTHNQSELAKIYTAADVFVNPTREDTFPTVNIESLACGTPVVTFDAGGSPEILNDLCGRVVKLDDIDAMEMEIKHICSEYPFSRENCIERANEFDMNDRFEEYVELYKDASK